MKNKIAMMVALMALGTSAVLAEETAAPKLASGLLMKQGGKLVFAPCRDRSYALVEDVSPQGAVTAALDGLGLEAGRKLYVELFAVLDGDRLKASGLNFARADGRCQMPGGGDEAWRAAGGEPSWALAAGSGQVMLKRSGKPDLTVPYAPFKTEGAATTYETAEGGNKLALRFEPGLCREAAGKGGADTLFGWKATVTANGQTLKGCAWQR